MSQKEKNDDPTIDLFPDDDADERGRKFSHEEALKQSFNPSLFL